jgi:aldehyde:ferredoxin oxidoreductase
MHSGNLLGLLMDATEQGRLPEELRLAWGDTPRMLEFLAKIPSAKAARRQVALVG